MLKYILIPWLLIVAGVVFLLCQGMDPSFGGF